MKRVKLLWVAMLTLILPALLVSLRGNEGIGHDLA